jgi:hypothetical protein
MVYREFTLPVHDPGAAERELNGFLASHLPGDVGSVAKYVV